MEHSVSSDLPAVRRFITTHNPDGKAVFQQDVPEGLRWHAPTGDAQFGLGYATKVFPVNLNDEEDIGIYQSFLDQQPGLMIPGGTVLRIVDTPPGSVSPMHRTVSLDYGIVIEGTIELLLDSKEVRTLNRGDVAIQRGTNHAWRNPSLDKWARMVFVLQQSQSVSIHGRQLEEDYGGASGIKPSKA